jgi:hypothetical protein
VESGVKSNKLVPGGTTTLAIYEEVTSPQGFIETWVYWILMRMGKFANSPIKFLGVAAS